MLKKRDTDIDWTEIIWATYNDILAANDTMVKNGPSNTLGGLGLVDQTGGQEYGWKNYDPEAMASQNMLTIAVRRYNLPHDQVGTVVNQVIDWKHQPPSVVTKLTLPTYQPKYFVPAPVRKNDIVLTPGQVSLRQRMNDLWKFFRDQTSSASSSKLRRRGFAELNGYYPIDLKLFEKLFDPQIVPKSYLDGMSNSLLQLFHYNPICFAFHPRLYGLSDDMVLSGAVDEVDTKVARDYKEKWDQIAQDYVDDIDNGRVDEITWRAICPAVAGWDSYNITTAWGRINNLLETLKPLYDYEDQTKSTTKTFNMFDYGDETESTTKTFNMFDYGDETESTTKTFNMFDYGDETESTTKTLKRIGTSIATYDQQTTLYSGHTADATSRAIAAPTESDAATKLESLGCFAFPMIVSFVGLIVGGLLV